MQCLKLGLSIFSLVAIASLSHGSPIQSHQSFPISGLGSLNVNWKEGEVYILPRALVESQLESGRGIRLQKRSPFFWGGGFGGGYSRPFYGGGGGFGGYGGRGFGGYRYNNGRLLEQGVLVGGAALGGALIGAGLGQAIRG